MNFTIDFLNRHPKASKADFLSLYVEFQTCLNSFLSENLFLENAVASLASDVAEEVVATGPTGDVDLGVLSDLKHALFLLSPELQKAIAAHIREVRRYYVDHVFDIAENPITQSVRETGDVPGSKKYLDAWDQWLVQVVEVWYAKRLGFDIDATAYYRRTVEQIIRIPFREAYLYELYNLATHASLGLSGFNRINRHRNSAMAELGDWGMSFFRWVDENQYDAENPEMIGGYVDAFCKGPSRCYDSDPAFGTIYHRLLDAQRSDGSWRAKYFRRSNWETEEEYLYSRYHPTWICVAALRPVMHDLANAGNKRIGVV